MKMNNSIYSGMPLSTRKNEAMQSKPAKACRQCFSGIKPLLFSSFFDRILLQKIHVTGACSGNLRNTRFLITIRGDMPGQVSQGVKPVNVSYALEEGEVGR